MVLQTHPPSFRVPSSSVLLHNDRRCVPLRRVEVWQSRRPLLAPARRPRAEARHSHFHLREWPCHEEHVADAICYAAARSLDGCTAADRTAGGEGRGVNSLMALTSTHERPQWPAGHRRAQQRATGGEWESRHPVSVRDTRERRAQVHRSVELSWMARNAAPLSAGWSELGRHLSLRAPRPQQRSVGFPVRNARRREFGVQSRHVDRHGAPPTRTIKPVFGIADSLAARPDTPVRVDGDRIAQRARRCVVRLAAPHLEAMLVKLQRHLDKGGASAL
mmetsp:Transcript_8701/g.28688  ORF Transcript_8701/g.28688 Transcript_8701/m.28688 type:complete len:276 (+) Transcript_8701:167-994(+)